MTLAYNMKLNPKHMKKMEKEYTVMKTKEQEEMVELRVCTGERERDRPVVFLCQHNS
jgi:hypothetical protein